METFDEIYFEYCKFLKMKEDFNRGVKVSLGIQTIQNNIDKFLTKLASYKK